VLHHQADLVAVTGEHDAWLTFGIADSDHVAVTVGANFVGKLSGPASHDVLHRTFVATGAGRAKELFEQVA
jgi:hypothetical protein